MKPWVSSLAPHKPVSAGHAYKPNVPEVEQEDQAIFGFIVKFEATLGYSRFCFKPTKIKINRAWAG